MTQTDTSPAHTPAPAPSPSLSAEQEQYLQILSIGHYVVAGLAFLFGCFPIIHLVFGVAMVGGYMGDAGMGGAEALFGCVFIGFALAFILSAWTYAYFLFVAGRAMTARKRHTLCLVMAGISCIFAPFGTVLGVFSLIVLIDPAVKAEFGIPAKS